MDASNGKSPATVNPMVVEVVDLMSTMVSPDNGEVTLKSYDEQDGVLELTYRRGANAECSACEVTDELLAAFTEEALKTRGVNVTSIRITPST